MEAKQIQRTRYIYTEDNGYSCKNFPFEVGSRGHLTTDPCSRGHLTTDPGSRGHQATDPGSRGHLTTDPGSRFYTSFAAPV